MSECDSLIRPHAVLGPGDTGISLSSFLFLVAVSFAVIILGLFIYKKFFFARYIQKALREEVMLEVQTQLADYVPLEERS